MYMIQIKLSPVEEYSVYRGWDETFPTRHEASKAKKRALSAGYYAVKTIKVSA